MPAFTDAQVASYIQNNNLDAAGIAQAAQVFGLSPEQISSAQGLLSSGDSSVGAASQAYQQAIASNPQLDAQNREFYDAQTGTGLATGDPARLDLYMNPENYALLPGMERGPNADYASGYGGWQPAGSQYAGDNPMPSSYMAQLPQLDLSTRNAVNLALDQAIKNGYSDYYTSTLRGYFSDDKQKQADAMQMAARLTGNTLTNDYGYLGIRGLEGTHTVTPALTQTTTTQGGTVQPTTTGGSSTSPNITSLLNSLTALKNGTINVDQFKIFAKQSGVSNEQLLSSINSVLGKNYTLQNLTEWLANPNPSVVNTTVPTTPVTAVGGASSGVGGVSGSGGIVGGLFGGYIPSTGAGSQTNTGVVSSGGSGGYSPDYWNQVKSYQERYFGGSGGAQTDASWNALRDLAGQTVNTGTVKQGTPSIDTSISTQPVNAKADYYNSLINQGWSDAQIRQTVEGTGAPQTDENWNTLVRLAQERRNNTGTIKEGLPTINTSVFYGSPEAKAAYYNSLLAQGWTDAQIRQSVNLTTGGSTDYGMLSSWYGNSFQPLASTSIVPRYGSNT